MEQKIYGYVRVSCRDQKEDRQMAAMEEQRILRENIFVDKVSGKDFERPQYRRMLRKLDGNSLLCIQSIDRLGRNYGEILEQWRFITREKLADIKVLDMPLLDTRRGKDLMGTFLSDIVLQVLSFVAEREREMIRARQAEGIAAARERGVRFGRPEIPVPENFDALCREWRERKISARRAAKECDMPYSTFYYKAKQYHGEQLGASEGRKSEGKNKRADP